MYLKDWGKYLFCSYVLALGTMQRASSWMRTSLRDIVADAGRGQSWAQCCWMMFFLLEEIAETKLAFRRKEVREVQTYQRGIRRDPQRPGLEACLFSASREQCGILGSIKFAFQDGGEDSRCFTAGWRVSFRNTHKIGASLTNKRHFKVSTIM